MMDSSGTQSTATLKEWLSSLVGNAPFGTIAFNLEGSCVLANRTAGEILLTPIHALVDRPALAIFADWPALAPKLQNLDQGGRLEFDLEEHPFGDGFYRIRGRMTLDGFLLTLDDVTQECLARREQSALVDRLARANQELEQFAYICAHDMKSPISNLLGLLTQLEADQGVLESSLPTFEMIRKSVDALRETSHALSDVLKTTRDISQSRGVSDFFEVAEQVCSQLDPIEASSVTIERSAGVEPRLSLAPAHLQSILTNLIGNSLKYKDPDRVPSVHVALDSGSMGPRIRVGDNGVGIDLERHGSRIFDLFGRVGSNRPGSGVGLYIVRSIVQGYGGLVSVDSTPDVGTTISVELQGA